VLVVAKLDRLGRNLLDILVVIQEIEAKGTQLVSIGECFDTTSPMGVAMFQVAGVFAQLERAMRGGSWSGLPKLLRSASRVGGAPDSRNEHLGFRLARTLGP
jgi:DNA invertase Pin-like site-specific DNA recombinase